MKIGCMYCSHRCFCDDWDYYETCGEFNLDWANVPDAMKKKIRKVLEEEHDAE